MNDSSLILMKIFLKIMLGFAVIYCIRWWYFDDGGNEAVAGIVAAIVIFIESFMNNDKNDKHTFNQQINNDNSTGYQGDHMTINNHK